MGSNVISLKERRRKGEIEAQAEMLHLQAKLLDNGAQVAADHGNDATCQILGATAHIMRLHADELLRTGKIQEIEDLEND